MALVGKANTLTATKANGYGNGGKAVGKSNGHQISPELPLEQRVNLVLSGIPLDEKVRMLVSWLLFNPAGTEDAEVGIVAS
jgi:hypothetical protein